ncbi:MAG: DUF3048 domain-containing protein [Christensenellales bacterium]|jgi:hypothetical protein
MLKKILCFILILTMALTLFGCADQPKESTAPTETPAPTIVINPTATPLPTPTPLPEDISTTTGLHFEEEYRPVGVMIENIPSARPQTGLQAADFVYETYKMKAEPRFLAIFSDQTPSTAGPIRSARLPFADIISEWDAAFAHAGGPQQDHAANVYDRMAQLDIRYRFDGLYEDGRLFWRDNSRSMPDNLYCDTADLKAVYDVEDYEPRPHVTLFDEDKAYAGEDVQSLTLNWLAVMYRPTYTYDADSKLWLRSHDGVPHTDAATGEQIRVKNVIVQYANCRDLGDYYVTMDTINESGKAQFFIEGKMMEGTWERKDVDSQTVFYDAEGEEFIFKPGNTWIAVYPSNSDHAEITIN